MAPFAVLLSNVLLAPVQAGINGYYIRRARHRLRELAPRVVGITGSYGKTSTKFILDTLLAEKFAVLKTPESFNTLMGVSRTINENLLPDHRVLIVEMGAYRRGDVRELCEFVRPQIGIITAIGPQHLERFGSIEAIQAAKQELIESLPPSGVAILNDDDPRCRELADGSRTAKVLRYGTDPSSGGLRIWAEQVGASSAGLRFVLATNDGQRAESRCVLLGRHNVLNVLAASCAALEFGLRLEEVAQAIPKIQPVPHRLQLIEGAGGVVVIDDSYNSNPVGALGALEALSQFTTGRRVLVTPGMVELGSIEQAQNEEFGAKAARVCDYIILVGEKQTRAVLRGVERERFPTARVCVVPGLGEARAELQKVLRAGDVVLFENDLPDLYIEA
jgi:UDP-N-acetylmuramoyl-tripeptide--D-alanyl-D-alanine ligase